MMPGKIIRADYRIFQFIVYLDFYQVKALAIPQNALLNRVREYFNARPNIEVQIKTMDNTCLVEFAKLDDAQMFVLSFSDVIDTHGVHFD